MPKGSDLLVAALANEGVKRIFTVPGEENLDVVESFGVQRSSSFSPAMNKAQPLWLQPTAD